MQLSSAQATENSLRPQQWTWLRSMRKLLSNSRWSNNLQKKEWICSLKTMILLIMFYHKHRSPQRQPERAVEGIGKVDQTVHRVQEKASSQNFAQLMFQSNLHPTRHYSPWRIKQALSTKPTLWCQDHLVKDKFCSERSQQWRQNLHKRVYLHRTRSHPLFLRNYLWKSRNRIQRKTTWRKKGRSHHFTSLAKSSLRRSRRLQSTQVPLET